MLGTLEVVRGTLGAVRWYAWGGAGVHFATAQRYGLRYRWYGWGGTPTVPAHPSCRSTVPPVPYHRTVPKNHNEFRKNTTNSAKNTTNSAKNTTNVLPYPPVPHRRTPRAYPCTVPPYPQSVPLYRTPVPSVPYHRSWTPRAPAEHGLRI